MSQEFDSNFEEVGCTRSGKRYKVGFGPYLFEHKNSSYSNKNQIQSPIEIEEGDAHIPYHPYTPQKPLGEQRNPAGTPSSSSQETHSTFIPPQFQPPSGSNIVHPTPPYETVAYTSTK